MPLVYGFIDLQGNELRRAVIENGPSAPTSPAPAGGQLWYDSAAGVLMWYNGTAWVSAGGTSVSPADSVVAENAFGAAAVAPAAGTATTYSRSDHTHGLPSHTLADHTALGLGQGTVTGVTGTNGVAVSNTDPAIPALSAVVDPASDPALTVGATGLLFDPAAVGTAIPDITAIEATIDATVDALSIITTSPSLTATSAGSSATNDLVWTLALDSLQLANTYTGTGNDTVTIETDLTGRGITSEVGDLYVNDTSGAAFISNDPQVWTALAAAGVGVTSVVAGNGVAVNAANAAAPIVSAVTNPASTALSVVAAGITLDQTAFAAPGDVTTEISAAITAAAGQGLVENGTTAGVLDIVASTTNPGIVVEADAIGIDPTLLTGLVRKFVGATAAASTGTDVITHSLGTKDVTVAVYNGDDAVLVDYETTSIDSITVFSNPALISARVVVIG